MKGGKVAAYEMAAIVNRRIRQLKPALVGGASLNADQFPAIIRAALS